MVISELEVSSLRSFGPTYFDLIVLVLDEVIFHEDYPFV